MTESILVLGGAGFIGSNLISYLEKNSNHNIISIGRGELKTSSPRTKHFSQTITLESLIRCVNLSETSISAVINCAGSGSVKFSHDNPREDFFKTTNSTLDILEFIRLHCSDASYIQVSSAAVYGQCIELPITTSTPLSPVSSYGFSNLISEMLVRQYANVYGVKSSILRVFSVYGEGLEKQILWDACTKIHNGNATFFGTGNEIRDFIHVRDLVRIISRSISLASQSVPVFNCGTACPTRIRYLVEMVANCMGKSAGDYDFSGEVNTGNPLGYLACESELFDIEYVELHSGIVEYCNWFMKNKKND